MSENIKKSHNVTMLLYHLVCPIKYRKKIVDKAVASTINNICSEIQERYEINFIEIGSDGDHVHFLIQSVPTYSVTELVTMIKSLVAREIFKQHPEIKTELWLGNFWSSGYFANTVGNGANEDMIQKYVQNQGEIYQRFYRKKD